MHFVVEMRWDIGLIGSICSMNAELVLMMDLLHLLELEDALALMLQTGSEHLMLHG
jgi:hypothetical protein